MNTRIFNNGPAVSEVGLGCWQFGGEWGEASDAQCLEALAAAADAGVTFIDTADVYGAGRSETLIGKFLRERNRDDFFIATKLGRLHGYPDGYSLDLFRKCTQDSLQRLGVEALDLTQLHCIPPHYLESGEVFDWLRTLRDEGLIKRWGVSVEAMDEANTCLKQDDLASLQVIFNVFRHKPIHTLFDAAQRRGVAIIARVPLASGLLAGKFTAETTFGERDHRNFNRDGEAFNAGETFAGLPFELGVKLADELKAYVPAGATMAQWSLRWVLDHDAVTVVIPGANKPQQARDNAAASDMPPLGDDVHAKLADWYDAKVKEHIRGVY